MDLPATINEVEPAIMSLLDEDEKKFVNFEGVDVTNYQSLKSAFDKIGGGGMYNNRRTPDVSYRFRDGCPV